MCLTGLPKKGCAFRPAVEGSIFPGAKLLITGPGLRQRIRVQPVAWSAERRVEFSERMVLYGTGIRNRASISAVTVTINGLALSPFYAGLAPGSIGEDQVNVALPASLAGAGTIYVTVSVAGSVSNQVTLCFTNPGNSPPACLQ